MIHKFTILENNLLRADVIPHPIIDSLTYVIAGRVLQVSIKLGIFETLKKENLALNQVAKKVGISEEGAKVLLECLEALGYLEQINEKFGITKRGKRFLLDESPSRMKNIILFIIYQL